MACRTLRAMALYQTLPARRHWRLESITTDLAPVSMSLAARLITTYLSAAAGAA